MKYLIIGRTGVGKDYLARLLVKKGLKQVISYTTRPKRYPEEDTHVFITEEEASRIPQDERAAETVVNGYEYFATYAQVLEADVYIIDPVGYYRLIHHMPDVQFAVLYVYADRDEALNHAVARGANKQKEAAVCDERAQSEDAQFSEFEQRIARGEIEDCFCIRNTYGDPAHEGPSMEEWAERLYQKFMEERR